MSAARLNSNDRLAGDAKPIGVARTAQPYELTFTVWSETNNCAAASINPSAAGRSIYGVLYEIPDVLLARDTAKAKGRKSLDAIEGEGTNYVRKPVEVITTDGVKLTAITYQGKSPRKNVKTSLTYVQHILCGLEENKMPNEYYQYVLSRVIENNSELREKLVGQACHGA